MLWQKLLGGALAGGIELVGGKTFQTSSSTRTSTISLTDLTGGTGSSPSENDIVIVFYAIAYDGTPPVLSVLTSGYTTIANIHANDTWDAGLLAAYKVMGSTPDTSVDVTFTGGTPSEDARTAVVFVFRNVSMTTPIDVTTQTATGINSTQPNPPSITPVTSGAVIVACGAGCHQDEDNKAYSSSDLSPFLTIGTSGYNTSTIGAGLKEWTSGAFNPAQFTYSGTTSTSSSWAAVTIAIRPK